MIVTLTPGSRLPESDLFDIPFMDDLIHVGMFGIQSFLMLKSFRVYRDSNHLQWKIVVWIILAGIFLSIFLEYMQKIIPNREFELIDLISNLVGILFGFVGFMLINKFTGKYI